MLHRAQILTSSPIYQILIGVSLYCSGAVADLSFIIAPPRPQGPVFLQGQAEALPRQRRMPLGIKRFSPLRVFAFASVHAKSGFQVGGCIFLLTWHNHSGTIFLNICLSQNGRPKQGVTHAPYSRRSPLDPSGHESA
jgi:hypothetical protein